MTHLKKVAILTHGDTGKSIPLDEILTAFAGLNIAAKVFNESDSIISFQPDCVIVTSPQHAKLTPFPTYGVINRPRGEYLSTPRFLRNIMTYDGYFTISPRLNLMLRDIMFGARKLATSILKLDFYPNAGEYKQPILDNSKPQIIIFENDLTNSKMQPAINHLLATMDNVIVATYAMPKDINHRQRYILLKDSNELTTLLRQYPIAICLCSGDDQEETLNAIVMKLIASGPIVITHQTKLLEKYFEDNLYYISKNTDIYSLPLVIKNHVSKILENKAEAIAKAVKAYQIFAESFAFDKQFPKLQQFHEKTLIDKGYVPNPDPAIEASLPSVTYIMRTGGKHRAFLERTLNCLVAQRYPDLRVLFVIHARFDYIHEIIAQYPSLKIKVIESIKSRRSEAIRDGMAAIETDLFGLFDDDDELFPNHVRTLVKTLQYHTNRDWRGQIGMVYSGSIHADDTHLVEERVEFRDHLLGEVTEKRAIEHFRFYSSLLMSAHSWFMPNGWLARKSIIDDELLVDPELDTCEDLYFELQIAQKAHLAFSAEVTAVHNFHHLGNSTIDDSHKHLPDTQRIALRNFMRVFPTDSLYDTQYNIVGKLAEHDPNQIMYQEHRPVEPVNEYYSNQFYPFRIDPAQRNLAAELANNKINWLAQLITPLTSWGILKKYRKLSVREKNHYSQKFKTYVQRYGVIAAIKKSILFLINFDGVAANNQNIIHVDPKVNMLESYFKLRVKLRYEGLWRTIKSIFNRNKKVSNKIKENI